MREHVRPLPPFYDLPRYTANFLKSLHVHRGADQEQRQREISVIEAMALLNDGCMLAEETDGTNMYECYFLSRTGQILRFEGQGEGHLFVINKDFARSRLSNYLTDEQLDGLRSHDLI
jgi:hypothetical protein